MIDYSIVDIVRRLLQEAYDKDRDVLSQWVARRARMVWLRHDPRTLHRDGAEARDAVASFVGAKLVETRQSKRCGRQVPPLPVLLLYRTAHLGAPRIGNDIKKTHDPRTFDRSRNFLLSLGDGDLYAALSAGAGTEVRQHAYKELSELQWIHIKNNLRNLALRTPQLTFVRGRKGGYIAHSKFFGGAPAVRTEKLGRIPGRVLRAHDLERLANSTRIEDKEFANELVWLLNEAQPPPSSSSWMRSQRSA
jgi:hypothetical protein